MNSAVLSKVFGWGQFVLTTIGTLFASGAPTGAWQWITAAGSLLVAAANHHASSTDGAK